LHPLMGKAQCVGMEVSASGMLAAPGNTDENERNQRN
jgi:hypothetical protein